jgi:serine/threonine protein phosphatase PrpC
MIEVIDVGVAHMSKRQKMRQFYGRILPEGVPNDQDAFIIDNDLRCYAVADGVGGSANSAAAANAVCEAYRKVISGLYVRNRTNAPTQREHVMKVLKTVNKAAVGALSTTTFTGIAIHPDSTASYLHVGDSQLVLFRDGELSHCTSEHVQPNGYQLLNYLGTQPEWADLGYARHALMATVEANSFSATKLEAEWGVIRLHDGDRLVLMTDGITGSGPHDRMDDRLMRHSMDRRLGAAACANALMTASRKEDDSTIVVVDVGYGMNRLTLV